MREHDDETPMGRGGSDDPHAEREADRLVQWLGEHGDLPDPSDAANAPFYEWWARELRAREGSAARAESERLADEFAARMVARTSGKGERSLGLVTGAPAGRTPASGGSMRSSIAAAEQARSAVVVDHAVAAGPGRDLWDEPAERWVDLPEGVPDGRYVVLTVAGDSMLPLLHAGDSVLVRVGPVLARQSIVVARRPDDGYVVKRVGALTAREVELTSLNPGYPPVRIPRDDRLVVGTVVMRWCDHQGPRPADGA